MKILLIFVATLAVLSRGYAGDERIGYVIGWGSGTGGRATGKEVFGQTTGTVSVAGQILSNVTAVSAGDYHCLALKSDGTVVGWGYNDAGLTATPPGLAGMTAVAAGNSSLALKSDGTLIVWGSSRLGGVELPIGIRNVTAISAGWKCFFALGKDGRVLALGQAKAPSNLGNVVAIASSQFGQVAALAAALESDGTVIEWNNEGTIIKKLDLDNVTAIAAGPQHRLALRKDGTVAAWGSNASGELDVPANLKGVVEIAAGGSAGPLTLGRGFSMALKSDGSVVCWGEFGPQQPARVPAGLSNVVAIAAGPSFCLAITTNADVAARFMTKP